jgi:hypothetical protein
MNLIDALCIIASSYNARSNEEEQVYTKAREMVEAHADTVMLKERVELLREDADQLLFGMQGLLLAVRSNQGKGSMQ